MTNNDGGGLDSVDPPDYKDGSLTGQKCIYDGDVLLGSRDMSKDGTELLLHIVYYRKLKEHRQLSTVLTVSSQVAAF